MIEKIALSLPIQGRSRDVAAPIAEGKGFAEELVAVTKTDEIKVRTDDPQENNKDPQDNNKESKKNGCCASGDKNLASGTPFASSRGA